MSRSITNDVIDEIKATELQPVYLFEGVFVSGTVRAWTGYGDLTWNGQTWTGTGTLLNISRVEETAEVSATGLTVILNGIPSEIISLALSECKQGASGKVYLGFIKNGLLVNSPIMMFEGRLDIPSIDESGDTSSVSISYESRLIDLERSREGRYTDEDQQKDYLGDKGFEFVPSLQDKTLTWGRG